MGYNGRVQPIDCTKETMITLKYHHTPYLKCPMASDKWGIDIEQHFENYLGVNNFLCTVYWTILPANMCKKAFMGAGPSRHTA